MTRRRVLIMSVWGILVVLGACGRTPAAKDLLATRWKENLDAPARKQRLAALAQSGTAPAFRERTVEFFPDGTGVSRVVFEDDTEPLVESFRWSLSADGRSLKTEDATGRVLVAKVTVLTEKELQIDDVSHANGQYARDR